MTQKDTTVYIGRFNPFHLGHAHVLEQALKTSKLVIVLVGSSGQARSLKNPFTYEERRRMIEVWEARARKEIGPSKLVILPLRDSPYSNNTWIKSVQFSVKSAIEKFSKDNSIDLKEIYLTGSDRDDSTWYLKAFPQWKLDLVHPLAHKPGQHDDLSASSVRKVLYESNLDVADFESLAQKLPTTTMKFLYGFAHVSNQEEMKSLRKEYHFINGYKKAWAAAPYAPTFSTADAVIIQSGHVLVVERGAEPGIGLWALPGGFVNQQERIKDAAIREAMEETGILLAEGKRGAEITESMLNGSIRAKEIFDDPSRSARGRTITVAYLMRLDDTRPLPKVKGQNVPYHESGGEEIVETTKAMWIPLEVALSKTDKWFEDHLSILEWAVSVKD